MNQSLFFFCFGYPTVPAPSVEKTIFLHWTLCSFAKTKASLFCPPCLFVCLDANIPLSWSCNFAMSLDIRQRQSSNFVLLFRPFQTYFGLSRPLCISMWIFFISYLKNPCQYLDWGCIASIINLRRIVIFNNIESSDPWTQSVSHYLGLLWFFYIAMFCPSQCTGLTVLHIFHQIYS